MYFRNYSPWVAGELRTHIRKLLVLRKLFVLVRVSSKMVTNTNLIYINLQCGYNMGQLGKT